MPKDSINLWQRESPDYKHFCGSENYGSKKILRASKLVSVQVRPQAPFFYWRNTQVRLKGSVLKTERSCKRRRGSNPFSSANIYIFYLSRDRAVWQLVGLITQRSQVQILLPQPIWSRSAVVTTSACHAEDRGFNPRRDRHFFWLCSSVGRARD